MKVRRLEKPTVALLVLNTLDAVLTLYALDRGLAVEGNPVVVRLGLGGKFLLVTGCVLTINQLGYGRWLWGICIIYLVVVLYTVYGILGGFA